MGFLKRGVVRDLGEAEQMAQFLHVGEQHHNATVIRSEKLLQRQNRKQLAKCEVLLRELRGICGKTAACDSQGHPGQRLRRTRHATLGAHSSITATNAEILKGFLQST